MSMTTEERNRILSMVETGQVSASQAAQLLEHTDNAARAD